MRKKVTKKHIVTQSRNSILYNNFHYVLRFWPVIVITYNINNMSSILYIFRTGVFFLFFVRGSYSLLRVYFLANGFRSGEGAGRFVFNVDNKRIVEPCWWWARGGDGWGKRMESRTFLEAIFSIWYFLFRYDHNAPTYYGVLVIVINVENVFWLLQEQRIIETFDIVYIWIAQRKSKDTNN